MSKNTIQNFPFDLYTKKISEDKDASKLFFKQNILTEHLLAQMFAYIASLQKFDRTLEGLIDSSTYVKNNFSGDDWHKGLYFTLMTEPRGNILPHYLKQSDPLIINYSGLVPLILAAHKQLNNTPYSEWSIQGLQGLVSQDLLKVMRLRGLCPTFTKEELLKIRNSGLTPNSGKTKGIMQNPISKYALVGTANRGIPKEFTDLPKLAQTVLTQIWVAYPTLRTNLMILDINDWDNIPEPLETSEVLESVKIPSKKLSLDLEAVDLPWDD